MSPSLARMLIACAVAGLAHPAAAQPIVIADILDGADPGSPAPAQRLVVDVYVDVGQFDQWNVGGLVVRTFSGVQFVYHFSGANVSLSPPGTANKFVTFLSTPKARNADSRFTGAIIAVNSHSPPGPKINTPTDLNVRFLASIGSPAGVGEDGFTARLVFDTASFPVLPSTVALFAGSPPTGYTTIASASAVFASTTGFPAGTTTTFTLAAVGCPPQGRLYVNAAAAPGGFGHSWATAYNDLRAALAHAAGCPGSTEIWVAQGAYRPGLPGGPRSDSFEVHSRTSIYGGFIGNETLRGQRNFAANPTVLSGDLNGDDTAVWGVNKSDNAYRVVVTMDDSVPPVIDGFTITGGWADDPANGLQRRGGGVYIQGDDPATIRNCIIRGNYAMDSGAALITDTSQGDVILENCTIEFNRTDGNGIVAIYPRGGMINCLVARNTGNRTILFDESSTFLFSCTVAGNDAGAAGVVVYGGAGASGILLVNTIVYANTGGLAGTLSAAYSNTQGVLFPGPGNLSADPRFVNAPAGNFRLGAASPCIDSGDTTAPLPLQWAFDLDRLPRLVDEPTVPDAGVPEDPHVVVDMGAYEYHGCAVDFNKSGAVTVQDLFDFLGAFFAGCP